MVAGPDYGAIQDGAIAVRGGRIAWVGARGGAAGGATRGGDRARRRRPVDHARPDRLPHAPRLRRQPRRGIRAAVERRDLRRDRACGRRDPLDGRRDARRFRSGAAGSFEAAPESARRRRRDDGRDQVGLRARGRRGSEDAPRRAARWADALPVTVRTTFLGAHALPPEFDGRADAYIDEVCERMLPEIARAGLVDAVDAFCERIGFSPAQTERVFEAARRTRPAGEAPRRAALATRAARGSPRATARCPPITSSTSTRTASPRWRGPGTVAVLLPGAFYFLRETQLPPIDLLRRHGVAMARRDRLQPRHLADDLAPPRAQHGVHALPADAAGSAGRRDARSGPRARARAGSGDAGSGQGRRLRPLERRAAGGARLRDRGEPAPCGREGRARGEESNERLLRRPRAASRRLGEERAAGGGRERRSRRGVPGRVRRRRGTPRRPGAAGAVRPALPCLPARDGRD